MTWLLLGLMLVLFALNAPVAVAVGSASLVVFLLKGDAGGMLLVQRLYGGADSFPLMAVPLFMIAGQLMDAGGLTRRLINLADALVGWMPGGMAAVAVVSAMFFAGISGSAAADTAAVGAVLIPAMIRNGYNADFAAAVQASAGSIGVIIPPSIPMILYGALTGASIGRLFAAGILPGLLIGLSLIGVAVYLSWKRDYRGQGTFSWQRLLVAAKDAGWALGAPVIILGGILGGVFTATESAAVAVFYALMVGLVVHRELKISHLPQAFIDAAVTSSVIMFIIASATAFSWLLTVEDAPSQVARLLFAVSENSTILLLLLNILLLLAGTIVETTAALILFVPVVAPLLPSLGIDEVQLGAIMVVNLAIGMLTPPLGVCLIVSSSLAGRSLSQVSRQVLAFLAVLLVDLLLIIFWPPLITFLPRFVH